MKDRILLFLQNENKSYAQFAEEIGVQPSGISHILSGRNNPSLDFVIKMLQKYPSLSSEWLLFGRGAMYKYVSQPTLFDSFPGNNEKVSENIPDESEEVPVPEKSSPDDFTDTAERSYPTDNKEIRTEIAVGNDKRIISKVLFFYTDKTFTEYRPG